jgi:hypothetical protein
MYKGIYSDKEESWEGGGRAFVTCGFAWELKVRVALLEVKRRFDKRHRIL